MYRDEILKLKKEKNAIILAHFYQNDEIQEVADFVGDSLALSKMATSTTADIIVFCGVYFMAETAKILSPTKKVLLPKKNATCQMAMMVDYDELLQYKTNNPDTVIITYVNTRANIKALSDVIVTSSNAEKIVKNYKDKKMMYVPDKNLGTYLKHKLGYNIDVWPGYCYIHENLKVSDILSMKEQHPNALTLIHPEAPLDVLLKADFVGSTKQILDYATASKKSEFIIGTDKGIVHALKKQNPNKEFYLLNEGLSCKNMKMITLEDLYVSLRDEVYEINVPEEVREKAVIALDKMMELS
ncbi:MAG: quinolinate synthase NadA [Candidatus Izemoplasmatales bacterium]|jgi:quinolinate synthase|nr:quinolinate synthase NadA [Candidatus Izemoplasmatales bacterium]